MPVLHPKIKTELENLDRKFDNQLYLSLQDVAKAFGMKPESGNHFVRRYEIPTVRIGGRIFVTSFDLAKFIAQRKCGNEPLMNTTTEQEKEYASKRRGATLMAENRQLWS